MCLLTNKGNIEDFRSLDFWLCQELKKSIRSLLGLSLRSLLAILPSLIGQTEPKILRLVILAAKACDLDLGN